MATDYVVRFTGQDNLSGTINQVRERLQEVGTATTQLDSIREKFQKIEQSTAPLKRRLRDLKQLMAQMNLDGLSGTDLFNQMAQQAGAYADALGDATQATNVFANDNFKLEAMSQGLQGIAGAASIATGIMGVLGTENEKVAQAILKVQSVLAILNGVQAVANVLNKDSALMLRIKQIRQAATTAATATDTVATTANTVATGANTAATVVNTTAQKAWNVAKAVAKALLGDWTGLVLVGAVALGTYALATSDSTDELEKQAEATDAAKEAQNKYSESVASNTANLVSKYKLLQNEWNNLKSVGEKTQWIKDNATEFKNLGLKVTDLKSAEDIFVKNTSNIVTALKARAKAMAAQTMLVDAYTEYYKKIMAADGSVAGGGFYSKYKGSGNGWSKNNPNITAEMKAAGVTPSDFNQRTTTVRSGGMIYDTTEYQESQKVIDKVNAYRISQASSTNKKIHTEAENQLNKTVDFATATINDANKVIAANGLDFSGSNNSGSGSGKDKGGNTNKPNNTPDYDAGSLAAEEAELTRLQNILKNTRFESDEARAAAIKAVQDQAAKVETMKLALTWKVEAKVDMSDDTIAGLHNQIHALDKRLRDEVLSDDQRQEIVLERQAKIKLLNNLELKSTPQLSLKEQQRKAFQDAMDQVGQMQTDYQLHIITKDEATEKLKEINKQLEKLGLKPIELYVNTNGIETASEAVESFKNTASNVSDVVGNMGNAFNSLSQAVGGTGGQMLALAGQTMQAIAQMIPQIVALIGAKEGEALASGTASAAELPFPANIAAIASIISTITALFASFAGSFADGGIISGGSFHGDKMLARVNAGEMILNRKQQANLFRALDSGGVNGAATTEIKIKGSDMYLLMKNYNNKMNKIK